MPKAIRINEQGGPEVLKWEEVELPPPGAGEVRLRHEAVGLNYIDTYHRGGVYKMPLPTGIGSEAAGIVEAVGNGVTEFSVGDRVAYAVGAPLQPVGSYSEVRNIPAARLVKIPDGIASETAAAMMLKGMTVSYLLKRTFKVKPGDTVVFHAAAGGVGLIACQWLKALGVTMIGTAGSDEKCDLAKAHGANYCINYNKEDFAARVKDITGGKGVPVVYDSVGKDTFDKSLECLSTYGTMVTFGNASGPVPPIELSSKLKGHLYVTRPSLGPYTAARADLVSLANDLFDIVKSGKVKIDINQRYALKDAVQAHKDLESRKTTGSTVFTV
ncbi:MAG TPA: quinone oxidoreductase [Vicinamibacterales bacterium]|nr:quinone oxidoreductase [Vicinamibacterales bacterium]